MVSELRSVLERYAFWPHAPRSAKRAQVATYALAHLAGAEFLPVRRDGELEAFVAFVDLPWDTSRLGIKTGRVALVRPEASHSSAADVVRAALDHARAQGYRYVFTRVDAGELSMVQALEQNGFVTLDAILSQYRAVDGRAGVTGTPGVDVRLGGPADADLLATITDATLRFSRFHADPWIGLGRAQELYREWARNSVLGLNDLTLIAEIGGEPAGFLSCREFRGGREAYGSGYCRIELVAVLQAFRGRGVVESLTARLIAECPARGWGTCGIGTQISNMAAIRAYQRAGFTPGDSIFTLRWLDPALSARGAATGESSALSGGTC